MLILLAPIRLGTLGKCLVTGFNKNFCGFSCFKSAAMNLFLSKFFSDKSAGSRNGMLCIEREKKMRVVTRDVRG